jgi:alkylated DNA nucleotide flippase Atl1
MRAKSGFSSKSDAVFAIMARWNAEQRQYSYGDIARECGLAGGSHVLAAVLALVKEGRLRPAKRTVMIDGWETVSAPSQPASV